MRSLRLILAFVLATVVAAQAQAGLLYVADNASKLRTIDPSTLAVNNVGPLGIDLSFPGLAYDPTTDTLYGVTGYAANRLVTIDRATGAATLVGTHGIYVLVQREPEYRVRGVSGVRVVGCC